MTDTLKEIRRARAIVTSLTDQDEVACGDCGETVRLGLLTTAECPHCGRAFADIDPRTWFFKSSRLVVADRPALDGDVDGADTAEGARDGANRTDENGGDT